MRFFIPGFDYQQALQQLAQAMQKPGKSAQPPDQSKVQAAAITAQGRLQEVMIEAKNDERSDAMRLQGQAMEEKGETLRAIIEMHKDIQQMKGNHWMEMQKSLMPKPSGQPPGPMGQGKSKTNGHDSGSVNIPAAVLKYDKSGKRVNRTSVH